MTEGATLVEPMAEPTAAERLVAEAEAYLQELNTSYQTTLGTLAVARHTDRQESANFVEPWEPSVRTLEALAQQHSETERSYPTAERLARILTMSKNAEAYKTRIEDLGLLDHQVEPFGLILDYLSVGATGRRKSVHDAVRDVVGGAYAELPPGFGKTALMAHTALALGIGTRPNDNPETRELRALVLVPSRRILDQTVGEQVGADDSEELDPASAEAEQSEFNEIEEVVDGFAKFAPDLTVSRYEHSVKDLSGQVVVMTYHSFRIAVAEGRISNKDFDVILADEAHHLLGPRTREARWKFSQGQIPVVGFTATSAYSEERQLGQVLKREICDLDFRTLIEAGILPEIQLLRVATGNTLKVKRRRGDFSDAELAGLAHDEARNASILNWVQHFVGEGRRVFVPSIRGDNCWHARELATLAASEDRIIYDDAIGKHRPMRTAAIGSFLSKTEIDKILHQWDQGKIDALFVVGMLGEGWNSSLVDVVVDGAPTASPLVMEQRVGRLTRFNPEWPVKAYVCLMDNVQGHKPQYTPWHVLKEPMIDPDIIIGRPGSGRGNRTGSGSGRTGRGGEGGDRTVNPDALPTHLAETLSERYILIDEVTITRHAERYKDPEPNFVPLADHYQYWQGMDLDSICRLLARNGFPYQIARGRMGPMRHVHADGIEFLKGYKMPPIAPLNYHSVFTLEPRLGVTSRKIYSLARELSIEPQEFRTRKSRIPRPHFSDEDFARMQQLHTERSTFRPGDEVARRIGEEYGLEFTSVAYRMAAAKPPINGDPKTLPSGQSAIVLDSENAARLRAELDATMVTPQNRRQTINMMAQQARRDRKAVYKALERTNKKQNLRRGTFRDAESGKLQYGQFLEWDDALVVLAELGVPSEQAVPQAVGELALGGTKTPNAPPALPPADEPPAQPAPSEATPAPVPPAEADPLAGTRSNILDLVTWSGRSRAAVENIVRQLGFLGSLAKGGLTEDEADIVLAKLTGGKSATSAAAPQAATRPAAAKAPALSPNAEAVSVSGEYAPEHWTNYQAINSRLMNCGPENLRRLVLANRPTADDFEMDGHGNIVGPSASMLSRINTTLSRAGPIETGWSNAEGMLRFLNLQRRQRDPSARELTEADITAAEQELGLQHGDWIVYKSIVGRKRLVGIAYTPRAAQRLRDVLFNRK
jgi:superfamily II DNA or RNA helicase